MKKSIKALFVSALAVGILNAPAAMAQAPAAAPAATGAAGAGAGAALTTGLTPALIGTAAAITVVAVAAENSDGTTGTN